MISGYIGRQFMDAQQLLRQYTAGERNLTELDLYQIHAKAVTFILCDLFLQFNTLWLVFIVKIKAFFSIFCLFIFPGSGVSYLLLPVLSRSAIFYENGIRRY